MSKSVKIYSFYYQPHLYLNLGEPYYPVWAGKNGKSEKVGFIGDDSGDNISDKNKYYSELSGIYWVWKNTKSDIIGSCHYRRYFTNAKETTIYRFKRFLYYFVGIQKKRFGLIYTNKLSFWENKILTVSETRELLEKFDIILPARRKLRQSIGKHYNKYHNQKDLILVKEILTEFHPDYIETFDKVLNDNRLFANNMFIANWDTFNSLMNWLFFILFKLEEKIDLDNYTDYQERIFGFLSERLITLWIIHNKLNYKELPLIYLKKLKKIQNV